MPLKLEQSHKQELVELLLTCPCTQHDCQQLIDQLPAKMQRGISLGDSKTPKMQLASIVQTYLDYQPDLGPLLEAVRFFDAGSLAYNALEKYVQELKEAHVAQIRQRLKPPPPPEKFGGRSVELANLKKQLTQAQATIALTAVAGQGGIGKTTLARKAAHELFEAKQFPAVLWVEVKPEPNPEALLLHWARIGDPNFATDGEPIKNFTDRIKANLEKLMAECGAEQVLVVFDDVWEDGIPAVELLRLAIPDHATILITTRHEDVWIQLDADKFDLSYLKPAQAVDFLRQYLADEKLSDAGLTELAAVLGGHALAMTLAAKRLLREPTPHRVGALVRHIGEYKRGLPTGMSFDKLVLDKGNKDKNLELSLSYSYKILQPDEQTRFRALGALLYDQPFDLELLAYLWEVTPTDDSEDAKEAAREQVREWANRLCNLSLLEGASETDLGDGWYRQHPLLHAYALALLKTDTTEYTATLNRYYDGTIEITDQFNKLPPEEWKSLDPYLPHIFATGDYLVGIYQDWDNLDQYRSEIERARDFALNIHHYLSNRLEVPRQDWLEMGLTMARKLGNQKQESLFLHQIGFFYNRHGEKDKAFEYYEQSLLLDRVIGDRGGEATTLNNIGSIYSALGEKNKALEYYELALPLYQAVGDQGGEATTLNNIGLVYDDLGEKNKALEYYEQALPLYQAVGDRGGEAVTSFNIGMVYEDLGQLEQAIEWVARCVELDEAIKHPDLENDRQTLARLRAELAQQQEEP